MRAKLVTAASSLALATGQSVAQDGSRVYVEIGAGAAFPVQDELTRTDELTPPSVSSRDLGLDDGFSGRLLIGFRVTPYLAIEAEGQGAVASPDNDFLDDDITLGAWTVNAVLSGPRDARFVPYAGIGIGGASFDGLNPGVSFEDNDWDGALAYQVKAGVLFPVGEHHAFGVQAGYLGTDGFETVDNAGIIGQSFEMDYDLLTTTASYRYSF